MNLLHTGLSGAAAIYTAVQCGSQGLSLPNAHAETQQCKFAVHTNCGYAALPSQFAHSFCATIFAYHKSCLIGSGSCYGLCLSHLRLQALAVWCQLNLHSYRMQHAPPATCKACLCLNRLCHAFGHFSYFSKVTSTSTIQLYVAHAVSNQHWHIW